MRRIVPIVGALVGFTATLAHGNMLINGSMDTPLPGTPPANLIYASPTSNSNALPGWSITAGTIDIVPTSYFAAGAGGYSVDMIGSPGLGSIRQTVTTISGNNYGLTFDLSFNPESLNNEHFAIKRLLVQILGADNTTVIATDTFIGVTGTRSILNMQYANESLLFEADGTSATIVFTALESLSLPIILTGASSYCGPVIDNVDLVDLGAAPPVPEPASLGVLALGAVALLSRRVRVR